MMNPETLREDPLGFLMPLLLAQDAQQQLEDKLVEVEKDFAAKQAILGWILDNPWIFAFLLQREVRRIDTSSNSASNAAIEGALVAAWENLRNDFCRSEVLVKKSKTGRLIIDGFSAPGTQADFKSGFLDQIKPHFIRAGADAEKLTNCLPPQKVE